MGVILKYIYEKFKYFHLEFLPHAKRPMDLFELFCCLEDAALEQKLIFYNEHQHGDLILGRQNVRWIVDNSPDYINFYYKRYRLIQIVVFDNKNNCG